MVLRLPNVCEARAEFAIAVWRACLPEKMSRKPIA
jgi:hypothetical protein